MGKYTYDQNGTAYHLKGGKYTCPSCGKHTLQLYIGVESGEPVNDQVGKCDRHYNCGYDYPPKAYYADHPDELPPAQNGKWSRYYAQEVQKPLVIIPKEYLLQSTIPEAKKGLCDFIDYLLQMFAPKDVQRVIDTYYLGHTKQGAVIFWQIDEKGLIREGKAMAYSSFSGGRNKASWATGESYWIFSTLVARGILPKSATSTKCIFGQHLLKDANKTTRVFITESEKNAIFGTLIMPNAIWLAVGSSQDIGKVRKVKGILEKCRSVVFVPDADALKDWREKILRFHLPNAVVSSLCAGHAGGHDLADFIHNIYLQHPQTFKPATPAKPQPEKVQSAESSIPITPAKTKQGAVIILLTTLFPEPYDYMALYRDLTLPSDFFRELEAAPF